MLVCLSQKIDVLVDLSVQEHVQEHVQVHLYHMSKCVCARCLAPVAGLLSHARVEGLGFRIEGQRVSGSASCSASSGVGAHGFGLRV